MRLWRIVVRLQLGKSHREISISKAIKYHGDVSLQKPLLDMRNYRPDQRKCSPLAAHLKLIMCSTDETILIYKSFWGNFPLAIRGILPSWSSLQGWLAATGSTASGLDKMCYFSL